MSVKALSHGQAGKHRQTGLTMLEAIAFLAISGLVMGGALATYSSASTSPGQVDPATASAACATKKNRVTLWSA